MKDAELIAQDIINTFESLSRDEQEAILHKCGLKFKKNDHCPNLVKIRQAKIGYVKNGPISPKKTVAYSQFNSSNFEKAK